MTDYVQDGYVASGYVATDVSIVFDATGSNPANLFTGELHSSITEPDIFPANGAFYAQGLVITGIPVATGVSVTLVPYVDYSFSPLFLSISDQTGLQAYSYILLTNFANWTSVTLTYQAVGVQDSVLLQNIVAMGNFTRTSLAVWNSIQGQTSLISAGNISNNLTTGAVTFLLAKKMESIASALGTPSSFMSFITGEFATLSGTVNTLNSIIQS